MYRHGITRSEITVAASRPKMIAMQSGIHDGSLMANGLSPTSVVMVVE